MSATVTTRLNQMTEAELLAELAAVLGASLARLCDLEYKHDPPSATDCVKATMFGSQVLFELLRVFEFGPENGISLFAEECDDIDEPLPFLVGARSIVNECVAASLLRMEAVAS